MSEINPNDAPPGYRARKPGQQDPCLGCAFRKTYCDNIACLPHQRSDGHQVRFVKVRKRKTAKTAPPAATREAWPSEARNYTMALERRLERARSALSSCMTHFSANSGCVVQTDSPELWAEWQQALQDD